MDSSNITLPLLPEQQFLPEGDYELFKREFAALSGILLDLYKENQMKRRINTLIGRKKLRGYDDFLARLREDPEELAAFIDYITINVTEFFRTPEQWKCLDEEVLPALRGFGGESLKIWSCACATGEEAWSLAISAQRANLPQGVDILATDLNPGVIEQARAGLYTDKALETLPPDIRARYFVRQGSHEAVSDELRASVIFRTMDLLRDAYPAYCDLIVCRNVLIYFTEEAKDSIYTKLSRSLRPGGYLFTGNTEQIIYYRRYGLKKIHGYLYQKA